MRGHFFLTCSALMLALGACAPRNPARAPTSPRVHQAYRLLDQGRTREAITLLEELEAAGDSPDEVRHLLASAHATLAGVDIYAMFDAFKDVIFRDPLATGFLNGRGVDRFSRGLERRIKEALATDENGLPEERRSPLRALKQVDALFASIQVLVDFFGLLPEVRIESRPELLKALRYLETKPEPKAVLNYRFFLRVILLRAILAQDWLGDPKLFLPGPSDSPSNVCDMNQQRLSVLVHELTPILQTVADDFVSARGARSWLLDQTTELARRMDQVMQTGERAADLQERALREWLRARYGQSLPGFDWSKDLRCD